MNSFRKRTYTGVQEFFGDLCFLLARFKQVRKIMIGKGLDPAFRERLMLAVTRVNDCRHCIRFHTKAALDEGMAQEEIRQFLAGEYDHCPETQMEAVLFAERWAHAGGQAEAEDLKNLISSYGAETAQNIQIALRIIRAGNLTGNSIDALLFKISLGRWGNG